MGTAINAIEGVIARGDGDTVAIQLLARSGALVSVHIGMACAGEGRRAEGVTLVVSLGADSDEAAPMPQQARA